MQGAERRRGFSVKSKHLLLEVIILISFGFNSLRLAWIFGGKFENRWFSSNEKLSSS